MNSLIDQIGVNMQDRNDLGGMDLNSDTAIISCPRINWSSGTEKSSYQRQFLEIGKFVMILVICVLGASVFDSSSMKYADFGFPAISIVITTQQRSLCDMFCHRSFPHT
jgi:hypothetical protein